MARSPRLPMIGGGPRLAAGVETVGRRNPAAPRTFSGRAPSLGPASLLASGARGGGEGDGDPRGHGGDAGRMGGLGGF